MTSAASPQAVAAETGRGFTRTTIRIGVATTDDASAYAGALGLGALDAGNPSAQMDVVAAYINRRGGLLGRKIELVKHDYNTAELVNDPERANQAACATWTQDKPVFAILPSAGRITENLLACAQATRTPILHAGGIEVPRIFRSTYVKYPLFFHAGSVLADRYYELMVRRLVARGFFTGWDTRVGRPGTADVSVGVIATDDAGGRAELQALEAQLARYKLDRPTVVRCPPSVSESVACQQSAVLRMQSDGVTHMFGVGVFFLTQAENQGYRPRYSIGQSAAIYAVVAPHSQLNGTMAASVVPLLDVEQAEDPGDPTPATGRCRDLMRKAGQDPTARTTMWSMGSICDSFFFLEAGVNAAGGLSPEGLRVALESMGARVQSALTWTTQLGPDAHATAVGVRDLAFRPETCEGCNDGRLFYIDPTTHRAAS